MLISGQALLQFVLLIFFFSECRYAGAVFAHACLKGLNGVPDVVECSFVQSTVTELPFFASKVRLGKNGVEEVFGLGELSDFEKQGLENLKGELKASIEKGIKFAHRN